MDYRTIIFLILYTFAITLNAQTEYPTESKNDLYWQPNVQVSFSHFQEESDTACIRYYEKYGLQMSSNIGFRYVVDIPKSHLSRKIKKRTGCDKSYLAPVFCKNCSCVLSEDTLELEVHQLLFDVAEMCARGARRELSEIQSEMNINNVNTTFFTTVKNRWEERMRGTFGSILRDVLIQKKDGAYVEWRELVDEILEMNELFATQPEDIYRLILEKPVEQDYVEAKWLIGKLRSKEDK